MGQSRKRNGARSLRLKRVSFALIVLAIIVIVGDIAYVLANQFAGDTPGISAAGGAPLQSEIGALSPDELYTLVTDRAPFLNDPLSGSRAANWDIGTAQQGGYVFRDGALHGFMIGTTRALVECALLGETFNNFAFQVHIAILQGDQAFVGLFFRSDQQIAHTYRFYVDFYGDYNFTTEQNANPVGTNLSIFQPALPGQKSLMLTVIAMNTFFYLYLNKHFLRKVTDASYSAGGIGFFVTRGDGASTDVAFSQAEVWKL